MLYNKNKGKKLDMELFKDPTSEYRAAPFWAWNSELNRDLLLRQIEYLKEMGFGGFHMHSRSGMATPYLSDEFMNLVKACRDKAEEEGMLAWLYDEDRYPSGFAGGFVTENPEYRQKMLRITSVKKEFVSKEEGVKTGKAYLLATLDVTLDENGFLKEYRLINENEEARGLKRYAYVEASATNGWWNGTAYVDTLSEEAIKKFIDITYTAYEKAVGESFGKSIPAMFTDEPQVASKWPLHFPDAENSDGRCYVPWTSDLEESYVKEYGESLVEKLPELFWDLPHGKVSLARYRYHDHVCQRFVDAFIKPCSKWCEEHGISLTGHLMAEASLTSQCRQTGEAMRSYEWFGIPGIDILKNNVELTTAKQAQSAKHQCGRHAMLSEMYGVTNWDFDFKSHKFQGDWQAALGVTVRVPHLSWFSMKGSAKRDYPASINYQAPWYKDYKYIEDHFARLNTVLTRGEPIVDVGVIHPVESLWLHTGPNQTCGKHRKHLDENFENITKWLLCGMVDFDFISESLLKSQCDEIGCKLKVGKMQYKTIIVPNCETLRSTTFEILKKFSQAGGRVLFAGDAPKFIDAKENDEILKFYQACEKVSFEKQSILDALKSETALKILDKTGEISEKHIHAMRNDGDIKWLFLAPCEYEYNKHNQDTNVPEELIIELKGTYAVKLYDTIKGKIRNIPFETKNGKTYIYINAAAFDSFLFELTKGEGKYSEQSENSAVICTLDFKETVPYSRTEDNVLMLDMAEYKLDDGDFKPKEELSRIDSACRKVLGYPAADGRDSQPWVLGKDAIEHYVTLKFTFSSEIETNVCLAAEEVVSVSLNGNKIKLEKCGYYTDESIIKYPIGKIIAGDNILELKVPIGKRTSIENCFLLGDFDVELSGCSATITKATDKIAFGDIVNYGMPFYGGHLRYETEINLVEDADLKIRTNCYRGAAVKVYLDGEFYDYIVCPPYCLTIKNVKKGKHSICFELLGNRVNTFGPLHHTADTFMVSPATWYGVNEKWSYQYILKPTGILSSPVIEIVKGL